ARCGVLLRLPRPSVTLDVLGRIDIGLPASYFAGLTPCLNISLRCPSTDAGAGLSRRGDTFEPVDVEDHDVSTPVEFDEPGGRERGEAPAQGLRGSPEVCGDLLFRHRQCHCDCSLPHAAGQV